MASRAAISAFLLFVLAGCNGAPGPAKGGDDERRDEPSEETPAEAKAEVKAEGPVLRGRITDENGDPLSGVRVTLYGGIATRFKGQETVTDANGEYVFDPLETGAHTIHEDGSFDFYTGMEIYHPTHVSSDGRNWWDVDVPNGPGKITRKDFPMVRGGAVEGVVRDSSGAPARGLGLRLYHEGKMQFLRYPKTDEQGRFEELGLFPGEYVIDMNEPSRDYPVIGKVRVEAGGTAKISLSFD